MIMKHFLGLLLALFASTAVAQTRGTPTLSLDQSGVCRNISVWDLTKSGTDKGVPFGCVDTTNHAWQLPQGTTVPADAASLTVGPSVPITPASWLQTYLPGATLPGVVSQYVVSPNAKWGAQIVGVRASDNTDPTLLSAIAGTDEIACDNTTLLNVCFGHYIQADIPSTSAFYAVEGMEIDVVNKTARSLQIDPFTTDQYGETDALRLASGGAQTGAHDISSYLTLYPNNAKALTGINIQSGALDIAAGYAPGLGMPPNVGLSWYASHGNEAWRLSSSSTTAGSGAIDLGDSTITISNATGPTITMADTASSRSVKIGMADGFNTTIDSIGGGETQIKAGGTTFLSVNANTTTIGNLLVLRPYTIATLPTCALGTRGAEAYVTDGQTSPTYLGTVSATGAVTAPVFCNGSSWVYH